MLIEKPFVELLEAFASSAPTPGGGSASALAGAVGASLLLMVARLPRTRHNRPEDRHVLTDCDEVLMRLQDELAQLVDRDALAYERLVQSYRLPTATDEGTSRRKDAIQAALLGAIETPLQIVRCCLDTMTQGVIVARHGNPSASSDVRVAFELLDAALRGGRVNVEVNLPSVTDAAYAASVREELARLLKMSEEEAAKAIETIGKS